MANIVNSLIQGLDSQMVQARLNTADASQFYFGTYFPVKRVNGFSWKTLNNQFEAKNVSADVHTDNGTIIRKSRPVFESAQGDIPFIAVSREMTRSELKDYQTALAFAQDADATSLVQYWGNDVDFCFNAVQAKLEEIAWYTISHAGQYNTQAGYVGEHIPYFSLDYQVEEDFIDVTTNDWNETDTAIIDDFVRLVKKAKALNLNPKFAFVNLDTFYKIATNEQVMKACNNYVANAVGSAQTPDLNAVNQMFARQAWLNGIQLRVIDQTISHENSDGTFVSRNPFRDDVLVLTETEKLGTTQYDVLAENNPAVIRAERAHTIIKKYGTIEPTSEITIGQADALPVLDTAYRNLYVKVDGDVDWAD